MRVAEYTAIKQLDEIAALQSIKGWFGNKFKALRNKNEQARQAGDAEVRKFINDHMITFGKQMGRYGQDWPTVTIHTIYKYLQRTMGLSDSEIVSSINNVMEESGQKPMTLQTIQDIKNKTPVGLNAQRSQITAEKIIAAGALAQLEKHWDEQAGVSTKHPPEDEQAGVSTKHPPEEEIDKGQLIKTPIVKRASDGYEYRLDVSPENAAWLRTDGSGEASGKIAQELSRNSTIKEYTEFDGDLWDLLETATGGATASGSIASVANPMGGVISRTPNLFGYIPAAPSTKVKKRRIRRKSTS